MLASIAARPVRAAGRRLPTAALAHRHGNARHLQLHRSHDAALPFRSSHAQNIRRSGGKYRYGWAVVIFVVVGVRSGPLFQESGLVVFG